MCTSITALIVFDTKHLLVRCRKVSQHCSTLLELSDNGVFLAPPKGLTEERRRYDYCRHALLRSEGHAAVGSAFSGLTGKEADDASSGRAQAGYRRAGAARRCGRRALKLATDGHVAFRSTARARATVTWRGKPATIIFDNGTYPTPSVVLACSGRTGVDRR